MLFRFNGGKCYSDSMEENAIQIQWKQMLFRFKGEENAVKIQWKLKKML